MRQDVDDFLIHICLFSNEWIISFIAAIHLFMSVNSNVGVCSILRGRYGKKMQS